MTLYPQRLEILTCYLSLRTPRWRTKNAPYALITSLTLWSPPARTYSAVTALVRYSHVSKLIKVLSGHQRTSWMLPVPKMGMILSIRQPNVHVRHRAPPIRVLSADCPIGPVCRDAICEEKLCSRKIFEPTDAELSGKGKPEPEPVASDSDSERKEVDEILTPEPELQRRPKGRQAKRKVRRVVESDSEIDIVDEDEDDDLSDFIVQSDEDEDEKDARAMLKKRLGKREVQKAIVIDSDEEGEHGSDDEVIIRPTKLRASAGAAALREKMKSVPKFLPSTKMKVCEYDWDVLSRFSCAGCQHMMESLKQWATDHPGEKVQSYRVLN